MSPPGTRLSSILDSIDLKTVVRGLRLIPAVHRPASILSGRLPDGTPVYVLRCPALFERDGGPYQDSSGIDWSDNTERFALLGAAAAMLCNDETPLRWHPTVMHINDWQAGLGAAFRAYDDRPGARVLASVHNLSFAGEFTHPSVTELGLPAWSYSPNGLEFYGRGSFLKAALFFADHITTVSPTYADEITTPDFGGGLRVARFTSSRTYRHIERDRFRRLESADGPASRQNLRQFEPRAKE